jgi:hypothetical protein
MKFNFDFTKFLTPTDQLPAGRYVNDRLEHRSFIEGSKRQEVQQHKDSPVPTESIGSHEPRAKGQELTQKSSSKEPGISTAIADNLS